MDRQHQGPRCSFLWFFILDSGQTGPSHKGCFQIKSYLLRFAPSENCHSASQFMDLDSCVFYIWRRRIHLCAYNVIMPYFSSLLCYKVLCERLSHLVFITLFLQRRMNQTDMAGIEHFVSKTNRDHFSSSLCTIFY